jgi:hypothetical protein
MRGRGNSPPNKLKAPTINAAVAKLHLCLLFKVMPIFIRALTGAGYLEPLEDGGRPKGLVLGRIPGQGVTL